MTPAYNICPYCGKTTGKLNPYRKGHQPTRFACGDYYSKCVSHLRTRLEALEAKLAAMQKTQEPSE